MRKYSVVTLSIMIALFISSLVLSNANAFDWRQAESGRYNIKLEGYQGQPGYVSFQDSGAHQGLLFAHDNKLYWYTGSTTTSDLETICDGGSEGTQCKVISFDN